MSGAKAHKLSPPSNTEAWKARLTESCSLCKMISLDHCLLILVTWWYIYIYIYIDMLILHLLDAEEHTLPSNMKRRRSCFCFACGAFRSLRWILSILLPTRARCPSCHTCWFTAMLWESQSLNCSSSSNNNDNSSTSSNNNNHNNNHRWPGAFTT